MNVLRPITVTLTVAAMLHTGAALAQSSVPAMVPSECGGPEITNAYGPFDYTNPTHFRERLPIVETYHFTLKVETLEAGETGTHPGGDLDYTLRAFPNHHRALYAMGRYQLMHSNMIIAPEARWTADCYFQRAVAFRPDDGVTRMIYGIYLAKADRTEQAMEQYRVALEIIPGSGELHNNVALLYIAMEDYDSARHHAAKAQDLGFPLPGARGRLERLGEWQDTRAENSRAETDE
ncbi:MAG: hypothetical protein QNI99_09685 [Woeseiaceae bacterium]|nr:hypothetical protein [Woeseiaceae bacterium]